MIAFAWMSEGEKMECATCTARDKIVRGCNGTRKWRVGRHTMYGCPQRLIDRPFLKAVEIWARWKRFGFAYAGGWAEQPARMFDVIEAVEGEYQAIETDKIERTKRDKPR